jgi:hypothetical protein
MHRAPDGKTSWAPIRKVWTGASAAALAAIVGYIIRTKVRGWEDFPTEALVALFGSGTAYLTPPVKQTEEPEL